MTVDSPRISTSRSVRRRRASGAPVEGMPVAGDLPDGGGAGMPGQQGLRLATARLRTAGRCPTTPTRVPVPDQGGGMPGEVGQFGGAHGGGGNMLSERFLASDGFAALYEAELERLAEVFYGSGLRR